MISTKEEIIEKSGKEYAVLRAKKKKGENCIREEVNN